MSFKDEDFVTKHMCLDVDTIKSLVPTKEFVDGLGGIRDFSFSPDCNEMITSTEDDVILVYNMVEGYRMKNVDSKKYGVGLLNHIGDNYCLHSSTKIDHSIRHLSLSDTKYLRYYTGHTKMVTGIDLNEMTKSFVTGSSDCTVRFWDCRTASCHGLIHSKAPPLVCYDRDGLVFAIATNNDTIKLYDVRSFDVAPFHTFKIDRLDDSDEWNHIEFSPCGKYIIISTNGPLVRIVDAFNGSIKQDLISHLNEMSIPLRATMTPDSKFVMVGSSDRNIYTYSVEKGNVVVKFPTTHVDAPYLLTFSQKYFCLVSICRKMIMWCPSDDNSATKT